MISKAIEVFAKNTNFKISENSVSGIYKKYFIVIKEKKNKRIISVNSFFGDADDNSIKLLSIGDTIKDNLSKFEINNYEITENLLIINSSAPIALLHKTLDFVVSVLEDFEIPNGDYCTACCEKFQAGSRKKVVSVNDDKYLLCDSCALEVVENANEEIAKKETEAKKANVFAGSMGALAGTLIGAVIYFLLFLIFPFKASVPFFKYALSIFGFIVGLFAYAGYKKIGKNLINSSIVSISFITAIVMFIAQLSVSVIVYCKLNFFTWANFNLVKLNFIMVQFTSSKQIIYLFTSFAISAVCAALAIFIFIYMDFKQKGTSKKTVVSVQTIK